MNCLRLSGPIIFAPLLIKTREGEWFSEHVSRRWFGKDRSCRNQSARPVRYPNQNLSGSLDAVLLAAIFKLHHQDILVVMQDCEEAAYFQNDLQNLLEREVLIFSNVVQVTLWVWRRRRTRISWCGRKYSNKLANKTAGWYHCNVSRGACWKSG